MGGMGMGMGGVESRGSTSEGKGRSEGKGIFATVMTDHRFAHRDGLNNSSSDIGQLAWQREKARPVVERLGWALHDRAAAKYNCEWLGQADLESYHALQEIVRKRAYTSVHEVEQLARTWYVSLGLYGLMAALEEGANRHHRVVQHEGKHRVGVVATELAQSRRNRCLDGVRDASPALKTVESTNMSSGLSLCEVSPISLPSRAPWDPSIPLHPRPVMTRGSSTRSPLTDISMDCSSARLGRSRPRRLAASRQRPSGLGRRRPPRANAVRARRAVSKASSRTRRVCMVSGTQCSSTRTSFFASPPPKQPPQTWAWELMRPVGFWHGRTCH